jgi:hypothetical protein
MNHEPWKHRRTSLGVYGQSYFVDSVWCGERIVLRSECPALMAEEAENQYATFARIVACVNAMQGIEDPEAFVQEAKSSLSPFRPFQPETIEAVKEALRNAPSETIVPMYEHLDIARRTIAIDPDDLKYHADYGVPPLVLHGVCDYMSSAREDLLRAQLEFAKNTARVAFGTALSDSVPDPDNPGLHIVEVLVDAPGLCPHCKAKLNTKTPPVCPDCGKELT